MPRVRFRQGSALSDRPDDQDDDEERGAVQDMQRLRRERSPRRDRGADSVRRDVEARTGQQPRQSSPDEGDDSGGGESAGSDTSPPPSATTVTPTRGGPSGSNDDTDGSSGRNGGSDTPPSGASSRTVTPTRGGSSGGGGSNGPLTGGDSSRTVTPTRGRGADGGGGGGLNGGGGGGGGGPNGGSPPTGDPPPQPPTGDGVEPGDESQPPAEELAGDEEIGSARGPGGRTRARLENRFDVHLGTEHVTSRGAVTETGLERIYEAETGVDIDPSRDFAAGGGLSARGRRKVAAEQFDEQTPVDISLEDIEYTGGKPTLASDATREVAAEQFDKQTPVDVTSEDVELTDEGSAQLGGDALRKLAARQLDRQTPTDIGPGDVRQTGDGFTLTPFAKREVAAERLSEQSGRDFDPGDVRRREVSPKGGYLSPDVESPADVETEERFVIDPTASPESMDLAQPPEADAPAPGAVGGVPGAPGDGIPSERNGTQSRGLFTQPGGRVPGDEPGESIARNLDQQLDEQAGTDLERGGDYTIEGSRQAGFHASLTEQGRERFRQAQREPSTVDVPFVGEGGVDVPVVRPSIMAASTVHVPGEIRVGRAGARVTTGGQRLLAQVGDTGARIADRSPTVSGDVALQQAFTRGGDVPTLGAVSFGRRVTRRGVTRVQGGLGRLEEFGADVALRSPTRSGDVTLQQAFTRGAEFPTLGVIDGASRLAGGTQRKLSVGLERMDEAGRALALRSPSVTGDAALQQEFIRGGSVPKPGWPTVELPDVTGATRRELAAARFGLEERARRVGAGIADLRDATLVVGDLPRKPIFETEGLDDEPPVRSQLDDPFGLGDEGDLFDAETESESESASDETSLDAAAGTARVDAGQRTGTAVEVERQPQAVALEVERETEGQRREPLETEQESSVDVPRIEVPEPMDGTVDATEPTAVPMDDQESEPRTDAPTDIELDTELGAEIETELETEVEVEAEIETEFEHELESELEAEAETEMELETEIETEPEREMEPWGRDRQGRRRDTRWPDDVEESRREFEAPVLDPGELARGILDEDLEEAIEEGQDDAGAADGKTVAEFLDDHDVEADADLEAAASAQPAPADTRRSRQPSSPSRDVDLDGATAGLEADLDARARLSSSPGASRRRSLDVDMGGLDEAVGNLDSGLDAQLGNLDADLDADLDFEEF